MSRAWHLASSQGVDAVRVVAALWPWVLQDSTWLLCSSLSADPCEMRELWSPHTGCASKQQTRRWHQSKLMHCSLACRCVGSLNALKQEALLWRERTVQVVRQNSLLMRQQQLRPQVRGLAHQLPRLVIHLAFGHAVEEVCRRPRDRRCSVRAPEAWAATGLSCMESIEPGRDAPLSACEHAVHPAQPSRVVQPQPALLQGLPSLLCHACQVSDWPGDVLGGLGMAPVGLVGPWAQAEAGGMGANPPGSFHRSLPTVRPPRLIVAPLARQCLLDTSAWRSVSDQGGTVSGRFPVSSWHETLECATCIWRPQRRVCMQRVAAVQLEMYMMASRASCRTHSRCAHSCIRRQQQPLHASVCEVWQPAK